MSLFCDIFLTKSSFAEIRKPAIDEPAKSAFEILPRSTYSWSARCDSCFTKFIPGARHDCSSQNKIDNILSVLSPAEQHTLVKRVIKDLPASEGVVCVGGKGRSLTLKNRKYRESLEFSVDDSIYSFEHI